MLTGIPTASIVRQKIEILGYGCMSAGAWICNESQMKCVTFFGGPK